MCDRLHRYDTAWSIQQIADNFVVMGFTTSFGGGESDIWILKLDVSGNVDWQRTYGGIGNEFSSAMQQSPDGGIVVAGSTIDSFGLGSRDAWVLKLDENGEIDPSCTFIGETFVEGIDSSATVSDTTATVTDTQVTGVDTNAVVTDLDLIIEEQCSGPECVVPPGEVSEISIGDPLFSLSAKCP